jgi:hypothetical protein
MRKKIFIFLLVMLRGAIIAQETEDDEGFKLKQIPNFSTKGIYLAGGFMFTEVRFRSTNANYITDNSGFDGLCFLQAQLELKNNKAINIDYSFFPPFYNKSAAIGINGHFPCYKFYKHKGIYIESGFSYQAYGDEYSFVNNSILNEHEGKYFKMADGLGYEYKLKYLQLYTMARLKWTLFPVSHFFYDSNSGITSILDFMIGVRLKMPKIFKKTKDLYHWF